jgi:hypothetical protein
MHIVLSRHILFVIYFHSKNKNGNNTVKKKNKL